MISHGLQGHALYHIDSSNDGSDTAAKVLQQLSFAGKQADIVSKHICWNDLIYLTEFADMHMKDAANKDANILLAAVCLSTSANPLGLFDHCSASMCL